jgi:3-oxoacyl-[acyl-carrier-protein] synthase II
MARRVAITGLGMANSLGTGVAEVWPRLLAGDNGITRISLFDASQYRSKVAAEVSTLFGGGLDDPDHFAHSLSDARRGTALFMESAREAFVSSGLAESGFDKSTTGVAAGVSAAFLDMPLTIEYYRHRRADQLDVDVESFPIEKQPAHNFKRRLADAASVLTAECLGLTGPLVTCDTACAASGHSIGEAARLIRTGRAKVMVAGGATAVVTPIGILYFAVLGALSRNDDPATASRPFHRDRDGFVMGEGGGAVVLEDWDHARARGATILAELAGFGNNTCALNLTDPSPDGLLEAQAMRLALESAGMTPEEIGYVAAHGTSTIKNDRTEAKAIRHLFGTRARGVLVSSNKGQLGHTIAGAAVTNLICAIKAMREGIVPPTANLTAQDPAIDLDCIPNQPRRAAVSAALINSFAFGGHNAVLAVRASS